MIRIEPDRMLRDLRKLATFGAYKTGVHRPTYSPQDMAARQWLMQSMTAAGLDASIDGIGNIMGRNPQAGRRLLVGSHSDSQNHAGWLDGALGVIYGLEIARATVSDPAFAGMGVDVAVWADEEAHFNSFLGSRSAIGRLDDREIQSLANRTTGQPLTHALQEAGLDDLPRRTITPADYLGYLEAHIEQGDYLDAHGLSIGSVTEIVGIYQYALTFVGERNHAGTTRMAIRKDAGAALVRLAAQIDGAFRAAAAPNTVWTVGKIELEPGQISIIPGRAVMMLQVRDASTAVLERFDGILNGLVSDMDAAGPCSVALKLTARNEPRTMDARLRTAVERAAETLAPGRHARMPSGAGHDAQILATVMPAAMLFVPSIGGISHHWNEDTNEDDLILGCEVLAEACSAILLEQ